MHAVFSKEPHRAFGLLPRRRKLWSRNGYNLEVLPDGTIRGTKSHDSLYTEFFVSSVGVNTVTLWAVEASCYVGIDDRGNIVTSASKIPFCVLRENLDKQFFNVFSRDFAPRRPHCLSVSAQGKVRSSILTNSKNAQFMTSKVC